jgi:hypothetical protein
MGAVTAAMHDVNVRSGDAETTITEQRLADQEPETLEKEHI